MNLLHSYILSYIGKIARITAYVSDIRFKQYHLQKGQHIFVVRVCEHPGLNLAELTQMLNVDKSTTTKAIQKLETAGYITKQHPPDNKKSISLFPTQKALDVYDKIIGEENVRIDYCFQGFTEEEKQQALNYLERMAQNVEDYIP